MFLVTDVTGHVGRAVLAELANQPVAVRALLQEPVDLPIKAPNIEAVRPDPEDPSSLQRAFEGVEAAFLASGYSPHIAEAHLKMATAAKAAGVRRFVQLSGVGANPQMCCARMLRWLGQAESGVAACPDVAVTRLRPAYMLQLLFEFAPTIAQQGLIAGPFRSNAWSWVDARDVAAVAVAALKDPSHAGRIYTVTGSESLSFPQIADRLSHILAKPVRYHDITANEARGWLQGKGLSPVMIEAKLEYWDACASNMLNVPPNTVVQDVTGRPPRSLEAFVQDYKARFLSASAA
ncbi:NmrA family NAD(P)-binding protein [Peristeroidobacter agariperforans]|uniref:NmrA family NAD(P)-binding protein n=1 Tax=Peristeroidobacter agariperforans TaxID=268404 RepID=UPI00101BB1D4|nr:NAD(P)H-binding protein [Peristeroidobacter agariperforans]